MAGAFSITNTAVKFPEPPTDPVNIALTKALKDAEQLKKQKKPKTPGETARPS